MKEVIVTGATVEEAVDNGCSQLGVEQEAVDYEVIEQPQQKILGIFGGSPAKVRVFVKVTPSSVAIDYLTEILTNMGVKELEITEEVSDERTILNISGNDDDLGVVIGHRGETLTALQYLVSLTANNACEGYFKVSLNVKNFREKREKTLEKVASKTAFKAVKLQKNIALEPMSPYERSIIHTAVQKIDGVTSWSVDENEKRHVVIGPEGLDEGADGIPVKYAKLNSNRRDYGSKGYGRNGRGDYNRSGRNSYGKGRYDRGNRNSYRERSNYSRGYDTSANNSRSSTPKSDYEGSFSYGKIDYSDSSND